MSIPEAPYGRVKSILGVGGFGAILDTLYFFYEPFPKKLMMFFNGTTKDGLTYKDFCKEEYQVRIAYNNDDTLFAIDNITNTMVEYPHWVNVVEGDAYLPYEFEILASFFSNYNVKPDWINCNYTWGWYDNETDSWTGAIGQVELSIQNKMIKVLH